jgi:hypothetical protein
MYILSTGFFQKKVRNIIFLEILSSGCQVVYSDRRLSRVCDVRKTFTVLITFGLHTRMLLLCHTAAAPLTKYHYKCVTTAGSFTQ